MPFSAERAVPPSMPLTSTQLKNLENHNYSCAGRSLAEYPLQYFWNWLVRFVPIWVAPNTLTVIGLAINTLSTLVLFYYTPHASETAPSWVYFLCAISFFVYQALDAIDGKHARRTNCSTPLGELFDHGCDAVSLAFVGLAVPCSMRLGDYPLYLFISYLTTLVVFYCAHWRTYICGTLEFSQIDVTEAQLSMMMVHLVSGVCGPEIWRKTVFSWFSMDIDIQFILLNVSIGAVIVSVLRSIQIVLKGGQGKNGSTIADTSVLSPSIPVLVVLFLSDYIYRTSPAQILQTQPVIGGLLIGFVCAKLCINLVIAHMSKSGMVLMDHILLPLFAVYVNIFIGSPVPEFYWTSLMMAWACYDVVSSSIKVCQQLCVHLNIYCFYVGKRSPPSPQADPAVPQT
ncbi:cholinephosphotransferase 1-like [Sycon ciliatum]|uniref:cholinephosphotransferase 1-like n=1 Tax=Sycon ciliatum TaxID=27933 RepID=UPI0020AB4139|eukprot:scpid37259/ scgid33200/ Cholinephosphotransferase 1; Diacylglycerol cholinephosphotransferase 1